MAADRGFCNGFFACECFAVKPYIDNQYGRQHATVIDYYSVASQPVGVGDFMEIMLKSCSMKSMSLDSCHLTSYSTDLRNGEGHGATWCGVNRGLASPRSGR